MKKNSVVFLIVFCVAIMLAFFIGREFAPLTSEEDMSNTNVPLYEEITAIKNRLTIMITEPGFMNPVPTCDFYEYRQQESDEYFQTTINYQVYQHGKGVHGDLEAFVEIYNRPNNTTAFVVEVTRNCWNELTVYLDGKVVTVFPTVTQDNALSLGYITFPVFATESPSD